MLKSVINEDNVKAVRKLLEESERIVITCHKSPDGDAIGSAFGLAHTLANIGKEAKVVTPDRPPRNLRFLPGVKKWYPTPCTPISHINSCRMPIWCSVSTSTHFTA